MSEHTESSWSPKEIINTGIAVVAVAVTIYGIWTTTESKLCGDESLKIAQWECMKEFYEYCESNGFPSPDCDEATNHHHMLPPPKIGTPGKTSTLSIVLVSLSFSLLFCLSVWPYLVRMWHEHRRASAAASASYDDIGMGQMQSLAGSRDQEQLQIWQDGVHRGPERDGQMVIQASGSVTTQDQTSSIEEEGEGARTRGVLEEQQQSIPIRYHEHQSPVYAYGPELAIQAPTRPVST